MKILSEQYYLLIESNKLAIYNIKDKKVEALLSFPEEILEKAVELNSIRRQLSEDTILAKILKSFETLVPYIFKEVQIEQMDQYIEREDFIENFIELHKDNYTLKKHMIRINVKNAIYFKKYFIYSKNNDLSIPIFREVQQCKKNIDHRSESGCHIIDRCFFSQKEIERFEYFSMQNNVERIYFGEQLDNIVVGPALFGSDYGCTFCNEEEKEFIETSSPAKKLISSILQYELLQYNYNLLSFSTKDNTLCKGKYFKIQKKNFSGIDRYIKRKFDCKVCGGIL
jgi:hypothetical protein